MTASQPSSSISARTLQSCTEITGSIPPFNHRATRELTSCSRRYWLQGSGPMGLTICDMSVSLDGYVTGPNDSRENPFGDGAQDLHAWLRPAASEDDRSILQSTIDSVGAIVMGRTSFEKNEGDGGWGDAGPMG